MTDLTPDQVMVLQSTWNAALAAMTLGILWNARSPSVYFWCLSGLLGSAFSLLSIGPLADLTYPTYWGQTLLGSVLVTGASMKVAAIGLMTPGVKLRRPVVTGLMMLASLTLFPLMGVSRAITSFLIILYLSALLFWLVQQVFQLGKRLSVTNGKLFAALIAAQAILIFLLASVAVLAGRDPLVPITQPLPVGTVAYSMVIS
ncbi:MAG: hypothetical protein RL321_1152, partial [Pseudomonadota bacterium]